MNIVDIREQLPKHNNKVYRTRSLEEIEYLVIHHSATLDGDGFSFARYHVNTRDWPGIAYHYVILKDGTIQYTNELEIISYHVGSYNHISIGICLVGDFTREEVTTSQQKALKEICNQLLDKLNLEKEKIVGHDQLTGDTLCPGVELDSLFDSKPKDVEIFINKEEKDIPNILKDGVTYVAIRPLASALGYNVYWEESTRRVFLEDNRNNN